MNILYHIYNNAMIISINDKTYTLSKDDRKFKIVYDLIKSESLETVGFIVSDATGFENYIKVRDRLLEALKDEK